jgi:hypothetical protein
MRERRSSKLQPCSVVPVLLLGLLHGAWAMEFEMQTTTKCVFEEINNNVLVVGDYKAYHKEQLSLAMPVSVKVRSAPLTESAYADLVSAGRAWVSAGLPGRG